MFYTGKRVLVTGGTGFVGVHIVQQLLKQGARVVVPLHHRALPPFEGAQNIELVGADLFSIDDCLKVTRHIDFVFHAAGGVGAAGVGPVAQMELIRKNLVLTAQVLEASWKNDVQRILIFSSSTIYPVTRHPVKETEAWDGEVYPGYLGYGWMRRYFEKLSEFVKKNASLRVIVIRPTAIYGRFDNFDPGSGHVIPSLIRRAVERERPFVVWGTGEEQRDFLHVSDLARGCLLALEKALTDPINIGYGRSVTIKDIVQHILNAAGYIDAEVIFDSSKPATIPVRLVDTSRSADLLDFRPSVSLVDGIEDTVSWYRSTRMRQEH